MSRILIFRHGARIPPGLLSRALEDGRFDTHEVALNEGDPIPELDGYSALVVLGGQMGAYDENEFPWLDAEKQAIREAHQRGMPMLGICLGAQLFADALGGDAFLAEGPAEIAHVLPELTDAGRSDHVLRQFDAPVVSFHQDTFDPPPGATILARSDRFPHAFRLGSAVAIQAHPEADAHIVGEWVTNETSRRRMAEAEVDPAALVAAVMDGETAQAEMARRLFGAWLDEVREHDRSVD